MKDLIELLIFLALLSTGHHAARGSGRVFRDVVHAFAWWVVIFGGLMLLLSLPRVLEWTCRIGVFVAGLYALWWLVSWLYHELAGVPEVRPVSRRHILRACRLLPQPARRTAAEAARRELQNHRSEVVLAALVEALLNEVEQEKLEDFLSQECTQTAERNELTRDHLRVACRSKRRADRALVAGLALRYGHQALDKAIRQLGKRKRPDRMRLPALVWSASQETRGAALLGSLGVEVHRPRKRSDRLWNRLALKTPVAVGTHVLAVAALASFVAMDGPLAEALARGLCSYLLVALFMPLYVYIGLADYTRSISFGTSYLLLLAYAAILFSKDDPAGWVFLAAVGLLHVSSLIHLRTVCETTSERKGGT